MHYQFITPMIFLIDYYCALMRCLMYYLFAYILSMSFSTTLCTCVRLNHCTARRVCTLYLCFAYSIFLSLNCRQEFFFNEFSPRDPFSEVPDSPIHPLSLFDQVFWGVFFYSLGSDFCTIFSLIQAAGHKYI